MERGYFLAHQGALLASGVLWIVSLGCAPSESTPPAPTQPTATQPTATQPTATQPTATQPVAASPSGQSTLPTGGVLRPELPAESVAAERPAAVKDGGKSGDTGRASTPFSTRPKAAPSTKENEKYDRLFENWPQPKFVLLVTGQQMGYLEPCGCTGLANQKGGLARRHSLARQLQERNWPVVALDAGNQVRRFGKQAEIQFRVSANAMAKIGYQAIALGVDDLRLPAGDIASATLPGDGETSPFLSANAAVLDRSLTPTHRVVEAGGKKIGITAILGTDLQAKISGSEIILRPPADGLDEVVPRLKQANCDVLVLLSHASIAETHKLTQKFPDFDLVVTAGGLGEPTFEAEAISGTKAIMVQVGLKGMFAGVVGYFADEKTPWRYERVPLDARFPDSSDMLALMAEYQEELRRLGFDGLGLKPLPHPSGVLFAGTESCRECHQAEHDKWRETPHAHATESLVHPGERSEIPRHFDPECVSCHMTGWNPQRFFPYESGYLSLEKTPRMLGSGCENCHGPGAAHVAAEQGEGNPSEEMLMTLRAAMRLPLEDAEKKCLECHDLDNSPDFHEAGAFEKYWKVVEH